MAFKRICAGRILTESGWLEQSDIIIGDDGMIQAIHVSDKQPDSARDVMIMPALIDSHIHGAAGADVMDASHDALNTISLHLAKHGVGAFLATTVTAEHTHIESALKQIDASYQQGLDGAALLGCYLEGPFFTARNRGAHPEALLHAPTQDLLTNWIRLANGTLKCVALAPEHPDTLTLIPWLRTQGVRVMLGHTSADYALTKHALLAGANGVVHCYNGMSGLHHREPGVVGVAFTTPHCEVEIIVDGHHVHFAAVDVAHRCCGDRLLLISDAMRATGMPDGDYKLGELMTHMQDGIVRAENGSLAGSTLTLENAVHNLSQVCTMPFEQAWLHGSLYPARALGLDDQLGTLTPGKHANLVVMSADKQILATLVNGRLSYCADNFQLEAICI